MLAEQPSICGGVTISLTLLLHIRVRPGCLGIWKLALCSGPSALAHAVRSLEHSSPVPPGTLTCVFPALAQFSLLCKMLARSPHTFPGFPGQHQVTSCAVMLSHLPSIS